MGVLDFIFGVIAVIVAGIVGIFYVGFKFDKIETTKKDYTKVYELPKNSNKNNKGGNKNVTKK